MDKWWVKTHVNVLWFCGNLDNIKQLWKFKHTEFLNLTSDNPMSTVSDPKIISSDNGFEVELIYFNIHRWIMSDYR
jgi:hypothetical protein